MTFIQNLISDDIIYALGWTMIHSLWQGMLIAFLLAFALYFLQKRSARLRYEIASLSLFLILFFHSLQMPISVPNGKQSRMQRKLNFLWCAIFFNENLQNYDFNLTFLIRVKLTFLI